MRPMEVQYITREMIARLKKPASLLWDSIEDGERERRAARWLVSGFLLLVLCLAVLLWVMGCL